MTRALAIASPGFAGARNTASAVWSTIALLLVACTDDRKAAAPEKLSRAECEQYAARFVQTVVEMGAPDLAEELRVERVAGCLAGDTDREELDCMLAAKDEKTEMRCTMDAERRRKSRGRP